MIAFIYIRMIQDMLPIFVVHKVLAYNANTGGMGKTIDNLCPVDPAWNAFEK